MYTGEINEPEIKPVKVLGVNFVCDDETNISLTEEHLFRVNEEWRREYAGKT